MPISADNYYRWWANNLEEQAAIWDRDSWRIEMSVEVWVCKWCGWQYRSPIPVAAVRHLCPRRDRKPTPLQKAPE